MAEQLEGIRWGRAILGCLLVEVVLGVVAWPFMDSNATLDMLIPPASFLVTMLVVIWLFRRAARPVANGVATGLASVVLYLLLMGVALLVVPDQVNLSQSLGVPYLAAHALKVLGGAAGGWRLERRRATPA